ncbi:nitroreductase family deazaflavin-dependent oxidoreductase [Streptomyces macrosporus]|uniref:Nitroreductase family deazaflavin-dependent oxidoreductase n=1 Tax=Streptomyces macrosporus TaxID=44032 RepID=A0ABN3JJH8_9ACTN
MLLTTTGHRTRRPHSTPLCAFQHDDGSWLVIATNVGRSRHPVWSTNLLHHPRATVHWRGRSVYVTARPLTPAEQQAERPHILAVLPVYDHYARLAARDIRVFRLVPRPRREHAAFRHRPDDSEGAGADDRDPDGGPHTVREPPAYLFGLRPCAGPRTNTGREYAGGFASSRRGTFARDPGSTRPRGPASHRVVSDLRGSQWHRCPWPVSPVHPVPPCE